MQKLYLKIDWQAMPACVARIQLDLQPHGWLFTPQTADGRAISGIDTESAAVRALSFKGEPAPDYFQLNEGLKWLCIRRPITMPNAAEELAKQKQKQLAEWWAKQPAWAKFAARDADNSVYLYEVVPVIVPGSSTWTFQTQDMGRRMTAVASDFLPPRVSENWTLDITARPAATAPQTFVATGGTAGGSGTAPAISVQKFPLNMGEETRRVEGDSMDANLAEVYLWWANMPKWANYASRDGEGYFRNIVYLTENPPTYQLGPDRRGRIWRYAPDQRALSDVSVSATHVIQSSQCMARPEHWWKTYAPAWARFAAKQSSGAVGFFSSRPHWNAYLGRWASEPDSPFHMGPSSRKAAQTAPFANVPAERSLIKRPAPATKSVDPEKHAKAVAEMARHLKEVTREYFTMDTFLQHAAGSFFRKVGTKPAYTVRAVEPEGVVLYKGGRVGYRDLAMYYERYDTTEGKWVPGFRFLKNNTPTT